jgi:hypothetical protein
MLTYHVAPNDKQFPLLFCTMLRRRTKDYHAVLLQFDRCYCMSMLLPLCCILSVPYCKLCQEIYHDVAHIRCAFHRCQDVWRKLQSVGYRHNTQVTCISNVSVDDYLLSIFYHKLTSPLHFRHCSSVQ